MGNIILDEIKQIVINRLQELCGYCLVIDSDECVTLESGDEKGNKFFINIRTKSGVKK